MTVPSRLLPILEAVRERLNERIRETPLHVLQQRKLPDVPGRPGFVTAMRRPGLSFIAEHKRRSPSEGPLGRRTLHETLNGYEEYGADAFSILTEEKYFGGRLSDLREAALRPIPVLRKDFVVDPYMIWEARVHGASAILLLANVLTAEELKEFSVVAHDLGLAVLLEVHDHDELSSALSAEPDAIGVNARDLNTFSIDLEHTVRLLGELPEDVIRVAESGIHTAEDTLRVYDAGADAALVGTALMRATDPGQLLQAMKGLTSSEVA